MSPLNLTRYHFLVVDNPRLGFENAIAPVWSFVEDRLRHFGVGHYELVSADCLDARLAWLLANRTEASPHYLVIMDILSPVCDLDLVVAMGEALERTGVPYSLCDGAVPGTEVRGVLLLANLGPESALSLGELPRIVVHWPTQERYNNQLNLYKYKRLKMFLVLMRTVERLYELPVVDFMVRLESDAVYHLLVGFAEGVRLVSHDHCPHCRGALHLLHNSMSQPFCGYLPSSRPLYHECEACGLVVQSPAVHEEDVHRVYDRWDKEDFVVSTNNPYTSESIRCDLTKLQPLLPVSVRTLDLGGGVGNFSRYLAGQYPDWQVTHSDFEIKAEVAADNISCRTLDFTRDVVGQEQYDLITAWEVIEHVPYHRLSFVLQNIWRALTPGGFFVFSTPDFDSPLCKSFDFYALCPPFHYLVFGEKWLRRYFSEARDFAVFDVKHCSDFLDDALNWYDYGSKTCPSMALRNTSVVLKSIFEQDTDRRIRKALAAAGMGTEIVMTLRKQAKP